MNKGTLQKQVLIGLAAGFSKVAFGAMEPLSDEEARAATAQASVEVQASLYTRAEVITIIDDLAPNLPNDIGGGRIRLEGFELGNDFLDENGNTLANPGRMTLTLTMEGLPVTTLDNGLPAVDLSQGDVLSQTLSDVVADVKIAAIRSGNNPNAPSLGQLVIEDLQIEESTTYLYAIQGTQEIGIDTIVNQSIGRIAYSDVETNGLPNPEGGGTLALNDIRMSDLDLFGTRLSSVSAAENPFGNSAAIRVALPSITGGSIQVGGVQVGNATNRNSAAYHDQQLFGLSLSGVQNSASDLYVFTPTEGDGVRLSQRMDMRIDDITVSAAPDLATVVRRALASDTETARQALDTYRIAQGYDVNGNPAFGVDAQYDTLFTGLTSLEGELAGLDTVDNTTLEARAQELNAGFRDGATGAGEGVGSVSLRGVAFAADENVIAIDIAADDTLTLSAPLTNGSLLIEEIRVGGGSLGSLALDGINVPVNTYRISGKQ